VADLPMRALGMMQMLASAYAAGETPWGPNRGIVDRATAVDAIMDLFAALDEPLQTGEPMPQDRLLHSMSMLMLVREYVLPLPSPEGEEELLRADLTDVRDALRKARDEFDLP
jgi:hypothetical protein